MYDFDLLRAQQRVWASDLTTPEKVTMQVLLAHWSRSGHVFPSVARIAAWTSQGRATVIRAIASLEAKGAIRCIRSPGRATHYDLTPLASLPVSERDRYQSETGITEIPHPSHSEPGPVSERYPNKSMNKSKKESKGTAPVSGAPPLALTAPSSKRAKRPRKAKARKPQPEQSSDHKRVVEHYFATFEAHRGEKPSFDGADGKAVQRLLDTLNGDAARACKAITDGFASWKGDTLSIRQIARDPSTFIGAKPRFNAANRVQNSGTDPFGESI